MPELLQDWVTVQAERRREAVAVVGDGMALTYGMLEELSNRLARILGESGCVRGDRVSLLMPKSPQAKLWETTTTICGCATRAVSSVSVAKPLGRLEVAAGAVGRGLGVGAAWTGACGRPWPCS